MAKLLKETHSKSRDSQFIKTDRDKGEFRPNQT